MEISASDLAKTYSTKTDDELVDLHGAGGLTEMAYEALENELRNRQIIVPARPVIPVEGNENNANLYKQSLKAHWRGEAPLWSAFWFIWVIGGFCANGLLAITEGMAPTMTFVVFPLVMIFFVFAAVSVWRCAQNTSKFIWKFLARTVVLFGIVQFVSVIVILAGNF